jgi:DUF4097 and DUF4098 domain-containing protein YvlB
MKSAKWPGLALFVLFLGCNVSVNKGVDIQDGTRSGHGYTSVNGSIRIGSDCVIRGVCRSVNGSIEVGTGSTVRKVQSVNGSILVMENARIREAVEAVNGGVEMEPATETADIKMVNGPVTLDSATVTRSISTYNGNITLDNGSIVRGDIRIKKRRHGHHDNGWEKDKPLIIEIMNGSTVQGDVIVADPEQKVDMILSGGGKVNGRIQNVNVIRK